MDKAPQGVQDVQSVQDVQDVQDVEHKSTEEDKVAEKDVKKKNVLLPPGQGKSEGLSKVNVKESPKKSPSHLAPEKEPGKELEKELKGSPIKNGMSGGENKLEMDAILDEIAPKYRVRAKKLLTYIDKEGNLTLNWNSRGRLIYKKMVINGSNIAELVRHFILNKGKKVVGFNLFRKGLIKINMPESLLLSKKKTKKEEEEVEVVKKWISY